MDKKDAVIVSLSAAVVCMGAALFAFALQSPAVGVWTPVLVKETRPVDVVMGFIEQLRSGDNNGAFASLYPPLKTWDLSIFDELLEPDIKLQAYLESVYFGENRASVVVDMCRATDGEMKMFKKGVFTMCLENSRWYIISFSYYRPVDT